MIWLPILLAFRVPASLALGVTALASLLVGVQSRRAPALPNGAVVCFRPPARWEWLPALPASGVGPRGPCRPQRLRLRAGWCFGRRLAALEWRLPDDTVVVALVGPRDLDANAWRRLRVCLAHARRSRGP